MSGEIGQQRGIVIERAYSASATLKTRSVRTLGVTESRRQWNR